jgi:hypothetical protein
MFPRTLIPSLRGKLKPGDHWLACAVWASPEEKALIPQGPALRLETREDGGFVLAEASGATIFELKAENGNP